MFKKHHDRLEDLETLENSFKDLQVQVNNSQNNLKNYLDEINNKSITEGNNLKLVVEGLETKIEEKEEEIVFLKKGFYTLGVAVVLIVLFLLFKGMQMISETYLKLLKSEVKKLDDLTNNSYEFETVTSRNR